MNRFHYDEKNNFVDQKAFDFVVNMYFFVLNKFLN